MTTDELFHREVVALRAAVARFEALEAKIDRLLSLTAPESARRWQLVDALAAEFGQSTFSAREAWNARTSQTTIALACSLLQISSAKSLGRHLLTMSGIPFGHHAIEIAAEFEGGILWRIRGV